MINKNILLIYLVLELITKGKKRNFLPGETNVSSICVIPNKGKRNTAALTAFLQIKSRFFDLKSTNKSDFST